MKEHVCFATGLLAAILGLAVAVDTAFADGCCGIGGGATCPKKELKVCGMSTCYTPDSSQYLCSGAKTGYSCVSTSSLFVQVNSFEVGECVDSQNQKSCNTTLEDCWRGTTCTWDNTTNPAVPVCVNKAITADNKNVIWHPANKTHTDDCLP